VIVPWWRSSRGQSGLQRAAASAWHNVGETTQVLMVCFELLSHVVRGGVVLYWVSLCLGDCLCGGIRFGVLCINVYSS
jgi:hypothetical protein